MQKFATTVTDQSTGAVKPLVGAQVFIYQGGTNNEAAVYEDNETTRKAAPLICDANGFVEGKLPNGTYDIYITAGSTVKKVSGFCAFDGNQSTLTITMPSQYTVTGGINVAWNKQAKNTFLAGPSSGVDATPGFRAISSVDLPFTGAADASKFLRGDFSWAAVPMVFTASFESAEQAITGAGLLNIAHGLNAEPKLLYAILVCKTAEYGYSVGDRITVPLAFNGSNNATAMAIVATSSALAIRYATGSPFQGLHFTTGTGVTFTNANWRLILRAFA
ncbi:hypothetical protein [Methylobacterium sp. Gmos1]